MTLSKIVSIVDSTEMRKGESLNSPSSLFAKNDMSNCIIADPHNFMQGNAMTTDNTPQQKTPPHFRIPRSLVKSDEWEDLSLIDRAIFLKVLELVKFEPHTFDDHGVTINLEPGQICITVRELHKHVGLNKCTKYNIESFLAKMKKVGILGQEIRHIKMVLTVTHLDTYNLIGSKDQTRFQTEIRQESDTNKEHKELKKATARKKEVVDDAAFSKNESYDFLVQFGVDPKVAEGLSKHPLDFIKEKVSLVMARKNIDNRPGWLIKAIERDYPVPKAECPDSVKAFRKKLVLDLKSLELPAKIVGDKLRFNDHVIDLNQSISEIIDHVNKTLINTKLDKNHYANY